MQEMQRNPEMMRQMMAMQGGGAGGGGMANLLAQDPEMLATMMQVCPDTIHVHVLEANLHVHVYL